MKMFLIIVILACPLGILWAAPTASADSVAIDSSLTELQHFDEQTLKGFREDSDFFYDRKPPVALGWWDQFKRWLWETFFRSIGVADNPIMRNLIFYGFIGLVLAYAAHKLSEGNLERLWKKRNRAVSLDFLEDEKDIRELDFEQLLQQALREKDFHRATRLLYLKALRQLTDRSLIRWQRDKTNNDYINELADKAIQGDFREITRIFDYVYYGEFELSASSYPEIEQRFENFYKSLGGLI